MRRLRNAAVALLLLLALAAALVLWALPPRIDAAMNTVAGDGLPPVPPQARDLHASLALVDLHADPLLWQRDLLARSDRGHVDLPRLREGRVALQVFGVVTHSPAGQNYERTSADAPDRITWLALAQAWPPRTWRSRFERARHQAAKLAGFAERSDGGLVLVRSAADLEGLRSARQAAPGPDPASPVGALLAIEGLHAMDGRLENLDALYAAGFRMMAPTHFFDNALGGSAAGEAKGGLTELGRAAVRRMDALGVVIDLAHASPRTVDDVLDRTANPVVVSHTGVQATCPGPRNLSDAQLRRIAAGGGVVGIGVWEGAVCGIAPADVARAMRHVRDTVGIDHVALGTDFDGTVHTAFDATGLAMVTAALLDAGFTEEEVRKAMGGNALRVLARVLPGGDESSIAVGAR